MSRFFTCLLTQTAIPTLAAIFLKTRWPDGTPPELFVATRG
jgi:hypothetical protein